VCNESVGISTLGKYLHTCIQNPSLPKTKQKEKEEEEEEERGEPQRQTRRAQHKTTK
jgi:hypothetical protein